MPPPTTPKVRHSWLCPEVVTPLTSLMYLLSRQVPVCRSVMHNFDVCTPLKVPRPRTWCIHRGIGVLPSPDEPKDRPATRRDTICTHVMEISGMERGETEENDRTRGKSNAAVGKVEWVSESCTHNFLSLKRNFIVVLVGY